MRKSLNTSDQWYKNAWAALIFFTRLPFWRIYQPPKECYRTVVEYWPLVGWLTGALMAATLYFGSMVFPYTVAVLLAIMVRLLVTGALHEDGLADFCDGFGGGGNNRQRILDIMKDSHIGTYGVIGLILYFALLFAALHSLTPEMAAVTIIAADPFAKMAGGQIVQMLPYARSEEGAKNGVVYRKINFSSTISLAVQGLLPMVPFLYLYGTLIPWQYVVFVPCLTMYALYILMHRKLRGYTGDCCGATFLLVELTFYLTVMTANNLYHS